MRIKSYIQSRLIAKKDEVYSFDDDDETLEPFSIAASSLKWRLISFITENVDTTTH